MKNLTKSLVAAAAFALTCGAAFASPAGSVPVTIAEGSIPGTPVNTFQADQLGGQYDEVLTTTATSTTSGTFVTEAIFNATGWVLNNFPSSSYLHGAGTNGYNLYVKFASTGTYSIVNGAISFTGGSGNLFVYVDPNSDTSYKVAATATGDVNHLNLVAGSTADDYLIGSATGLLSGTGNVQAGGLGTSNGNFELLFASFGLTTTTPGGTGYFTAPNPFNLELDLNGNFQSFNPSTTVGASSSVQLLNSSANAFFLPNAVPEPSALALAGIALVGAAVATRRKAKTS